MNTLLILVHNEEKFIGSVLNKIAHLFESIIIIDDFSSDNSNEIIKNSEYKNLTLISNKKNYGAGYSLQIGVNKFLELDSNFLIKIDGDDQFDINDIKKILNILETSPDIDFIKGDRFWEKGIVGEIPNIRYYGNALANFLIKFTTSNWKINDPLNGLFVFSYRAAKEINVPRLFNRYGYPYYLTTLFSQLSQYKNFKIGQMKNTIKYGDEKSSLKAFRLFLKIIYFIFTNYFNSIGIKVKFSTMQVSAILDIVSSFLLGGIIFSISKIIYFRYFNEVGSQYNWFTLTVFLIFLLFISVSSSQKIINKITSKNFIYF